MKAQVGFDSITYMALSLLFAVACIWLISRVASTYNVAISDYANAECAMNDAYATLRSYCGGCIGPAIRWC